MADAPKTTAPDTIPTIDLTPELAAIVLRAYGSPGIILGDATDNQAESQGGRRIKLGIKEGREHRVVYVTVPETITIELAEAL